MNVLLFFIVALHGLVGHATLVPSTPSKLAAANCTTTPKSGLITVDLRPDFTALGAQVPQRLTNIVTLLGGKSPNQKIDIFYEFAKPFRRNKKTILLSDSFYPKLSLDFVKSHFPSLVAKYNILQIHFRGSGCSATPPGLSPLYYTHEMVAADIEAVRRHLHIQKLDAFASGAGSFVMLTYALLFPDNVERVFLRDTAVRAPLLVESSDYFKLNLLPELITGDEGLQLQQLASQNPQAYASLLRYVAAAIQGGARSKIDVLVSQGLSVIGRGGSAALVEFIEDTLALFPNWSEAMAANECLAANESYDEINYNNVLVVPYVYFRCAALQRAQPQPLVEPLNFIGQLGGGRCTFFYLSILLGPLGDTAVG